MAGTDRATGPDAGRVDPSYGRFFLPGPTEVRPEVLAAQARPLIGHRGAGIQALMGELQDGLRDVFRTSRPVFVSTSSGTGLMEAAVRNGVRQRLLALVNGAFSERFGKIAEACGKDVETLDVPWGEVHDPAEVGERIRSAEASGRPFDAVTLVHSETSTGALNPVAEIAREIREAASGESPVVLVDSVTGVGGAPLEADAWDLDFVLTGSHKALALPPGLAFGVPSERMMARAEEVADRGYYFDFLTFQKQLDKLQTPTTPAISLLYATQEQLRFIRSEGMEGRWARHRRMAERTHRWVGEMRERHGLDLRILAVEGRRSPTVTNVMLPEGVAGPDIVTGAREAGFVIGGGYGKLKPEAFRIGHMGDHTLEELEALLEALDGVLAGQAGRVAG